MSSRYGMRWHPIHGGTRHHAGIDIATAQGTPVRAVAAGHVVAIDWHEGYGRMVDIDHGWGWRSRYAHLSATFVTRGMPVGQSQVIGAVGTTGISTGPHLHFELRYGEKSLNPLVIFANYLK
ncbi:MAG: M23 family metallopeptidase [Deltaproteobacteria bacterium]|nr:M23 family metallopeptidase [Deltaproteobacteria bacterium]